jgi:hypothetical protein
MGNTKSNKQLIDAFNEMFPIGSKCLWRSVADGKEKHKELTVRSKAFDSYGQAVVFFEEISGYCSIEPQFVDYACGVF